MIKFFRHIRKNLLMENKKSKYFKYAIGEIILVVIGILIALSINNWNELRKERLNEGEILKTLNEEFSRNNITLDSTLILIKRTENALRVVLQSIQPKPQLNYTPIQLDSLLNYTLSNPYWSRSEYTLRNLESSGKLSTLSNEELKSKLYEWSIIATNINDKDEDATFGFNHLLNYYKENGSLRNLDAFHVISTEGRTSLAYNHVKLFSDIVFENAIDDFLVFIRQRIERYSSAKVIIEQILEITKNDS